MFEIGETYTAKNGYKFECIAVKDTLAWMKGAGGSPAYVWTQDGKSISLSREYNIPKPAREFWINSVTGLVSDFHVADAIHVREVLPE